MADSGGFGFTPPGEKRGQVVYESMPVNAEAA